MTTRPVPADFLSGTSGQVSGLRRTSAARATDAWHDALAVTSGQRQAVRRAAASWPSRSVLALGIASDGPNLLESARAELLRSRHQVRFASRRVAGRGKFENLNALLAEEPALGHDWLLIVDDDVALPSGFLDAFVLLAERFDLSLAQPAHRALSHAAWEVTRRRPLTLARQTCLVEIGPVTALRADTFESLLPFPPLRWGWGIDVHWSAVAQQRGWRMGVIDAAPVRHRLRSIGAAYDRDAAVSEARAFLADRAYMPAPQAQRTVAAYRRL